MKKMEKIKRNIKKAPLSAYVVFSLSMVIVCTIFAFILTSIFGEIYDTIYTVFVGVFGGEVLASALIQIFKIRKDNEV